MVLPRFNCAELTSSPCRKGSRCALLSLREGDHIGEEALILNSRWSLSVVAAEYTEAVTLDADALLRCLRVTGALHFLGAPSVDEWLKKAAGGTAVQAAIKAAEQFQRQCRIVQTNISQTQQKKKIMQMLERTDIGIRIIISVSRELIRVLCTYMLHSRRIVDHSAGVLSPPAMAGGVPHGHPLLPSLDSAEVSAQCGRGAALS